MRAAVPVACSSALTCKRPRVSYLGRHSFGETRAEGQVVHGPVPAPGSWKGAVSNRKQREGSLCARVQDARRFFFHCLGRLSRPYQERSRRQISAGPADAGAPVPERLEVAGRVKDECGNNSGDLGGDALTYKRRHRHAAPLAFNSCSVFFDDPSAAKAAEAMAGDAFVD